MPNAMLPEFSLLAPDLERTTLARPVGWVTRVIGSTVEASGPELPVGALVTIGSSTGEIAGEVIGFREGTAILMTFDSTVGVHPGARVAPRKSMRIKAGPSLLGRVIDAFGQPIDGKVAPIDGVEVRTDAPAPEPLSRPRLNVGFHTGIRAIDGLLSCAKGQRIGIFAGSGVGKSVLLGSLAKHSNSSVNVIALIGERGREVREFVEESLGDGMSRSVVIVATSDQAPLTRLRAASTAMAVAEYFRDQGEDVLLLMDSVTRYAMARREIGLAAGEPPTTKGYPPSVFAMLPRLLERAGASAHGSITAFCTVLAEADDMNDPIVDTVRAILDGHIVLSRDIAAMNHYPAIDVLTSVSRVMTQVVSGEHGQSAARMRSLIATYRKAEDLVNVGAYVHGANPKIDEAISRIDGINAFLRQPPDECCPWDDSVLRMKKALS
jgi:flagellum-specific ATP synthase